VTAERRRNDVVVSLIIDGHLRLTCARQAAADRGTARERLSVSGLSTARSFHRPGRTNCPRHTPVRIGQTHRMESQGERLGLFAHRATQLQPVRRRPGSLHNARDQTGVPQASGAPTVPAHLTLLPSTCNPPVPTVDRDQGWRLHRSPRHS
jgi:hypothetical protein